MVRRYPRDATTDTPGPRDVACAVPDDGFWRLIDDTRPADGDPVAHAAAITGELAARGTEATVAWADHCDEALAALYRWDLWGAAYLLLGGCSDDGFEYVRCWIVGRGRRDWERAQADPDAYLADLIAGSEPADTPAARLDDLHQLDGEPLRYAAGIAHDQLTGTWLPASAGVPGSAGTGQPLGEPWDEADLPRRFPQLAARLPDGWPEPALDAFVVALDDLPSEMRVGLLAHIVDSAHGAFQAGEHATVVATLAPLLDDADDWTTLGEIPELRAQAAYLAAMSRFIGGDPDGAATWLHRLAASDDLPDHARRALAQIHLACGDLDGASALSDDGPDVELFDAFIRMVIAQRRDDLDEARSRADALDARLATPPPDSHPWDLAGIHVQIGFVRLELGDGAAALAAADAITELTADAPPEVPLVAQGEIIRAGGRRLTGDLTGAAAALLRARDLTEPGSCDRGLAAREDARRAAAAGRAGEAAAAYAAAVTTFWAAGERWLAEATETEADGT